MKLRAILIQLDDTGAWYEARPEILALVNKHPDLLREFLGYVKEVA
jgi:hypothetical protein